MCHFRRYSGTALYKKRSISKLYSRKEVKSGGTTARASIVSQCAWFHDDVIKWKHFPRYWPFVRGIHRSPVNSPHKGQWRGALILSLICVWINSWVNNRKAGDLRRYRVHCDVSVMVNYLMSANCCINHRPTSSGVHFTYALSFVAQIGEIIHDIFAYIYIILYIYRRLYIHKAIAITFCHMRLMSRLRQSYGQEVTWWKTRIGITSENVLWNVLLILHPKNELHLNFNPHIDK